MAELNISVKCCHFKKLVSSDGKTRADKFLFIPEQQDLQIRSCNLWNAM